MKSRKLTLALAAMASVAAMAWGPSAASADTYAPQPNAQTFATSAGGWTSSVANSGLCIPAVTCPIVTDTFQASGGAGGVGDGFIRSSILGVALLASTTTDTYESPAFAYTGNAGGVPATATFTMDRQSSVAALLAVAGNSATYSVKLFDVTAGTAVAVVAPVTLAGANTWTAIPAVSVAPSQLTLGHQYRIQVISTFTDGTGASLLPMGSADYDNVRLTTAGGSGGGGGNGGSGITNVNQLTQLILTQGLPNSATLKGNKLRLKVKCPKQAAPLACQYKSLRGLAKGKNSKSATSRRKATIKAGKFKKIVVKVKPKFLAKYQKAKKVTIKTKVSVGNVSATVTKKVKVIHQG